jgi:hypothetical protein
MDGAMRDAIQAPGGPVGLSFNDRFDGSTRFARNHPFSFFGIGNPFIILFDFFYQAIRLHQM